MANERVIDAAYVDWRPVRSRRVLQIMLEVPIERQEEVLKMLGSPAPDDSKRVAVALLAPVAQRTERQVPDLKADGSSPSGDTKPKERKRWDTMPLSQRAALLTKDPMFWNYLEDRQFAKQCDEKAADAALKEFCCTHSKAEIKPGRFIGDRYLELESNFLAWRQAVQHGAA